MSVHMGRLHDPTPAIEHWRHLPGAISQLIRPSVNKLNNKATDVVLKTSTMFFQTLFLKLTLFLAESVQYTKAVSKIHCTWVRDPHSYWIFHNFHQSNHQSNTKIKTKKSCSRDMSKTSYLVGWPSNPSRSLASWNCHATQPYRHISYIALLADPVTKELLQYQSLDIKVGLLLCVIFAKRNVGSSSNQVKWLMMKYIKILKRFLHSMETFLVWQQDGVRSKIWYKFYRSNF